MLERVKSWALGALAILTGILFAVLFYIKERLTASEQEVAQEKTKQELADAVSKQAVAEKVAGDAVDEFERVASDYERGKGSGRGVQ